MFDPKQWGDKIAYAETRPVWLSHLATALRDIGPHRKQLLATTSAQSRYGALRQSEL